MRLSRKKWSVETLVLGLLVGPLCWANTFEDISKEVGFSSMYQGKNSSRVVKIAVFDNDFVGYQEAIGESLPQNTQFIEGSRNEDVVEGASHGLHMAEVVTSYFTNEGKHNKGKLELYLFNVSGFTNLRSAIDHVIELKIDVVLHPLVREYGGNFDGKGFFNAEVTRATDAGILWVNAAGNFGKTTYNLVEIKTDDDDWVTMPGPNSSLPVRCRPLEDSTTCSARFVLSWNDFKDDPEKGTSKDLDLILTDDTLKIVSGSSLVQVKETSEEPGQSLYPREIVETDLKSGIYYLRVKNRSHNFKSKDKLRITAEGPGLTFGFTDSNESLLPPADNPDVITVGASDIDASSVSTSLKKPEIWAPSVLESDGDKTAGSSNSAAIVTAAIGILVGQHKDQLSREDAIELLTQSSQQSLIGNGLTSAELGFGPANGHCFEPLTVNMRLPEHFYYIFKSGGVLVLTTNGMRIMTPTDPLGMFSSGAQGYQTQRQQRDDMIVAQPQGVTVINRHQPVPLPPTAIEVFEQPSDIPLCTQFPNWPQHSSKNTGFSFSKEKESEDHDSITSNTSNTPNASNTPYPQR